MVECLRALRDAAMRPSLPALLGAMGLFLALAVLCLITITPELMAGAGEGYFLSNRNDEYAALTTAALKLEVSSEPSVFLLGASTLREALSSPAKMSASLAEATGFEVPVHLFVAGGATHWELAQVADRFRRTARGVVFLHVSPRNFTVRNDRLEELALVPRLAIPSDDWNDELVAAGLPVPGRTCSFFLDNYKFFATRLAAIGRNLVLGPLRPKMHMTGDWRPPSEKEWAVVTRKRLEWIEYYEDRAAMNVDVYRRLLRRLDENPDLHVVLIESLRNPRVIGAELMVPGVEKARAAYRRDLESLLSHSRAEYFDPAPLAGIVDADFIDTTHLSNPDARERYTAVLAQRAVRFLNDAASRESQGDR